MSSTSSPRSATGDGGDIASPVSETTSLQVTAAPSSISATLVSPSPPDTEDPIAWGGSIEPSMTHYCWSITQSTSTSDGIVRVSQTSIHVPCSSTSSVSKSISSTSLPIIITSTPPTTTFYTPHPSAHPPAFFAYTSVGAGASVVFLVVIACYLWWNRVGRWREPSRKSRKRASYTEDISGTHLGLMPEVTMDHQVRSQIEELKIGQERMIQMVQAQLQEKRPGLDGITYRDWNKKVEEQDKIDEKKAEAARLAAIGGAYASKSRKIANAVVQKSIAQAMAANVPQTNDQLDENGTQYLLRSEIGPRGDRTLFPDDSASGADWIRNGQYEERYARFYRAPRDPLLMTAAYANIHKLENPENFEDLVDEAVRWADQEHQQQHTSSPQSSNPRQREPQYYASPLGLIDKSNQPHFQAPIRNPPAEPRLAGTDPYQELPLNLSRSGTPRTTGAGRFIRAPSTEHIPNEDYQYSPSSGSRTHNHNATVTVSDSPRYPSRPLLAPLQTDLANTSYSGQPMIRTGSSAGTPKRSSSLQKHHEVHRSTSDLVGPDGAVERHTTTHTYTRETTPVQEKFPDDDISSIGPIEFARSEISYPYSTNESVLTTDPFSAEVRQNYARLRLEKERAEEERRSREEERARWRRQREDSTPDRGHQGDSTGMMGSPVQARVHTLGTEPEDQRSLRVQTPRSAQKKRAR